MERWLESFARAAFLRSSDTAHDLKTPLNVAVLNLELLRMRVRKLLGDAEDAKLDGYAGALDLELRRMAQIFDAFFILSSPPKQEGDPARVDAAALCREMAGALDIELAGAGSGVCMAHESRIREALRLFLMGSTSIVQPEGRKLAIEDGGGGIEISVRGQPLPGVELSRIFKFYYTDLQGNPDLSLATARLIAETYGGGLTVSEESDSVVLRLSLPPGDE